MNRKNEPVLLKIFHIFNKYISNERLYKYNCFSSSNSVWRFLISVVMCACILEKVCILEIVSLNLMLSFTASVSHVNSQCR